MNFDLTEEQSAMEQLLCSIPFPKSKIDPNQINPLHLQRTPVPFRARNHVASPHARSLPTQEAIFSLTA